MPSVATQETIRTTESSVRVLASDGSGFSKALSPEELRSTQSLYSREQIDATFATLNGAYSNPAWITSLDSSKITGLSASLAAKADLVGGLVPSHQLPSYVDDVIESADFASLPGTGESGKIYVTLATGKTYRWSGSAYVELTDATAVWGQISGSIANQTDLMSHLSTNYSAAGHTHTFAAIDSKPTTLSGYGITDALPISGGTLTGDLLFTDALYDIGKSGATRPRDGWFSRTVNVGTGVTIRNNTDVGTGWALRFNGTNSGIEDGQASGTGLRLLGNVVTCSSNQIMGGWGHLNFTLGTTDGNYIAQGGAYVAATNIVFGRVGTFSADGLHVFNRVTTSPSSIGVYETYVSSTSFGRLQVKANAGAAYQIGSAVGTAGGTNRAIQFGHWNAAGAFTTGATVDTDGTLLAARFCPPGANLYSNGIMALTDNGGTSGLLYKAHSHRVYSNGFQYGYTYCNLFELYDARDVAAGTDFFRITAPLPAAGGGGNILRVNSTFTTGGGNLLQMTNNGTEVFSVNNFGRTSITQRASTSGSPAIFIVTGGAHTNLAASTESTDVNFNLARTVQFANGNITTQRAFRIQAPVYSHVSGSNTIATASTFSISGAPTTIGGFTSITNAYSLNVESGDSYFAGAIRLPITSNGIYFSASGNSAGRLSMFGSEFYIDNAAAGGGFIFRVNSAVTSAITVPSTGIAEFHQGIRGTSNVLKVVNSTNAQTLQLHETFTSSTSFGAIQIKANAGAAYQIGSAVGSAGGSNRAIDFGHWDAAGTFSSKWSVLTTGVLYSTTSGSITVLQTAGGVYLNGNWMQTPHLSMNGWWGLTQTSSGGISFGSGNKLVWGSTTANAPATGTVGDIGLARNAAGVLEVNTGTIGTLAALTCSSGTFAAGTITNSAPTRITQAWNAIGTTFSAFEITCTGLGTSGATSKLFDITFDGVSLFKITKQGRLTSDAGGHDFYASTTAIASIDQYKRVIVRSDGGFAFANSVYVSSGATADTLLTRAGAGALRLVSMSVPAGTSTNQSCFSVNNTWTSSTLFEDFQIKANAGAAYQIGSAVGGAGGSNRAIDFGHWDAAGTFATWLTVSTVGTVTVGGNFVIGGNQLTFNTDTAIRRTSAGVFEINNGTPGTLRDLTLRNLTSQQIISTQSWTDGGINKLWNGVITPTSASSASTWIDLSSATTWGGNNTPILKYVPYSGALSVCGIWGEGSIQLGSSGIGATIAMVYGTGLRFAVSGGTVKFRIGTHGPWGSNTQFEDWHVNNSLVFTGTGFSGALAWDASHIFALRNSTNAQTLRVYETFSSATSFGTLQIKANAGAEYQISSAVGSAGGTNRALRFGHHNAAGTFVAALGVETNGSLYSPSFLSFDTGGYIQLSAKAYTRGDPAIRMHYGSGAPGGIYGSNGNVGFSAASSFMFDVVNTRTCVPSGSGYAIGGSTSPGHHVMLASATTGQMEINNGTIGTYRDLLVRDFVSSASITCGTNLVARGSVTSERYGSDPWLRFRRANGTLASPTHVLNNDIVGTFSTISYHSGGAFHTTPGAAIYFVASEDSALAAQGTEIRIFTTANGTTTNVRRLTIGNDGLFTIGDGCNLAFNTTTGTKLGTSASQKIGFWNASPLAQQDTTAAAASLVAGGGSALTDTDTFDGYTIAKVVKILRNIGLLA